MPLSPFTLAPKRRHTAKLRLHSPPPCHARAWPWSCFVLLLWLLRWLPAAVAAVPPHALSLPLGRLARPPFIFPLPFARPPFLFFFFLLSSPAQIHSFNISALDLGRPFFTESNLALHQLHLNPAPSIKLSHSSFCTVKTTSRCVSLSSPPASPPLLLLSTQ
jgi:hypothetical protein